MVLFQLAITEAERSSEVERAVDERGREVDRAALCDFLALAQSRGLIGDGKPGDRAAQFLALLSTDLQLRLLMHLAETPAPKEIERRAQAASCALLALYPAPSDKP